MVDTFARQRQLVGTTAEWAANDLVVGYGEFAIELVSPGRMRAKLGDGVSVFSALAYFDPSVTTYVNKAGDTMSGPLVVPELDAADAVFTGPVDLGAGAVVLEPADNDNTQRVPSTHWVQARVGGIITGLKLLGTWNAATNSPTLVNGVGARGDFYLCAVSGSTPLDGITSWAAGDSVVFNGVAWQKVPQTLNAAQIVAGLGYTPVNKAGDTMTGALNGTVATFTTGLTVGTSGVEGYVHINEGGPSNAGYVAFHKTDATRIGYLGFSNDRITYTAEMPGAFHEFVGPVKVPTPAAASDDTSAATTAWVRANTPPPAAVIANNAGQVNCGATGTYASVCNTGAIGAAGQKWRIEAGANVGNSPSGYDFISAQIWNGSALVGSEITVCTINGLNTFAACCAIVTLTAATTFSLRVKDNSSGGGYVLPGSWISAQRVS